MKATEKSTFETLKEKKKKPVIKIHTADDLKKECYAEIYEYYGVTSHEIKSRQRIRAERPIVQARQMLCWLLLKYSSTIRLKEIGKEINRHHATVLHSRKIINDHIDSYESFKEMTLEICEKLEKIGAKRYLRKTWDQRI